MGRTFGGAPTLYSYRARGEGTTKNISAISCARNVPIGSWNGRTSVNTGYGFTGKSGTGGSIINVSNAGVVIYYVSRVGWSCVMPPPVPPVDPPDVPVSAVRSANVIC